MLDNLLDPALLAHDDGAADRASVERMLNSLDRARQRQLEDRSTLTAAHREIARLRNALRATRDQARQMIAADRDRSPTPAVPSPHLIRAEYVVDLVDAALKDAALEGAA